MNVGALTARIDRVQVARPWLAFPAAVIKKFSDDKSGNLAVVITYYAFFSIFPLIIALFSILGFVLAGHADWRTSIETSTLKNLPLVGQAKAFAPHGGSVILVIFGTLLSLYSGLGVAKAAETAFDTINRVPRGEQPGFLPKILRALRLVVTGGVGLIATTTLSGTVSSGTSLGINVGWVLTIVSVAVSALLNTALFVVLFRWMTARPMSPRQVLPGAGFAGVAMAILQSVASAIISHKLTHVKSTYGNFGTVIVLLSWFYLQSQVLLLAAQVNVVKLDRLWPRPFFGDSSDEPEPSAEGAE